jgi:phosphoribosylamine---glycine ligase
MKILVVGSGAREASIATRLAEDSVVFAAMSHANPSIVTITEATQGSYILCNTNNGKVIAEYARFNGVDLAFVAADAPLAAGVCDELIAAGIKTVGPTRAGSQVEWDKAYGRQLLQEIAPRFNPRFWILMDADSIEKVFREIEQQQFPIVVKPQGLTGGKGVKVMGEHLESFAQAQQYALRILTNHIGDSKCVVIEEKLEGFEFTMQVLTDGRTIIPPPATYDFPYRYDGDTGPGTGGMGCLTDRTHYLPFMQECHYDQCIELVDRVIQELRRRSLHFNGVLNVGFFLTCRGLKVMEFNARFGDPECMNVMELLGSSLAEVLNKIADKSLKAEDVNFKRKASVVKYLVSPEYAISEGMRHVFSVDVERIRRCGVNTYFASAVARPTLGEYETVGNSRNVAVATTGETITEAAERIDACIERFISGPLEYRHDIGSSKTLEHFAAYQKDISVELHGGG